MQESQDLPESIKKLQHSLNPYVKQRQETAHIRRVLAARLDSSVYPDGQSIPRPLSLIEASCSIETTPHGIRGLQKEYLRCARTNIEARREYAQVSKIHQAQREDSASVPRGDATTDPLETFLDLVKKQQKHEVLCIVQDYIDNLNQKPTAATEYLDPKEVLKNVESLPQVPPEVLNGSGGHQRSGGVDLKDLVDRLEKSVLRAKLLLKREQKLLMKVKLEQGRPHVSEAGKLQALGTTRNELINWIETELSQAGESSPEIEDGHMILSPGKRRTESVETQLASIRRQYLRYTKARQLLVMAAAGRLEPQSETTSDEDSDLPVIVSESGGADSVSHIMYPYLEYLVAISNEQKAVIQQKSHLTINLAKQLKESSQSLERLAHESHLLPVHPMPTNSSHRKGPESSLSFADEISKHEKPDSSRGARAWVYASELASNLSKEAILEKLEEGSMAIDESRQTILELKRLLGDDKEDDGSEQREPSNQRDAPKSSDIWSILDGSLGVINQDGGTIV
ncbi:hypothetical protein LSUE1_G004028 [Lachnellula suecica]|uniref:Uncharacterized protein n=1 Tax=Lachnellula suecica TaxID=602035 RepID=A0A8T9CD59_9HELO|nr:hypothetical protein LSUE1_G004028 [Lachnellula suecica]